jgi:hypothetical protein
VSNCSKSLSKVTKSETFLPNQEEKEVNQKAKPPIKNKDIECKCCKAMNLQLQVTGLEGAEGKDQIVFLNSGEVKRDLMGSLAGPESPNPCSQRTKLRAIESGFGFSFKEEGCCWFEWDSSTNQMVLLRVIASTAIGFANSTSFISSAPSCSPFLFRLFANLGTRF